MVKHCMGEPPSEIELFYGQATAATAVIYARYRPGNAPKNEHGNGTGPLATDASQEQGLQIRGLLSGPECQVADALPYTARFVELGPGESLLAAAKVAEPCCWHPELPFYYRAQVQVVSALGEVVASTEQIVAIRRLGTKGQNLHFEGRRWVLRGLELASPEVKAEPSQEFIAFLRESRTALVLQNPADRLCETLSYAGVLVLAKVSGSHAEIAAQLRRLSRWPAVAMALIEPSAADRLETGGLAADRTRWRGYGPNLLLAQMLDLSQQAPPQTMPSQVELPPIWGDVVLVPADAILTSAAAVQLAEVPVIAWGPSLPSASWTEQRRQIDLLQARLAPVGDYAGYIVQAADQNLLSPISAG